MKKRLRKKLRLLEFQEMCFDIKFRMTDSYVQEFHDAFLVNMTAFAESNGLFLAGNFTCFNVSAVPRHSVTELQRQLFAEWLMEQPTITAIHVSPLFDAWYTKDED